MGTGKTVIGKRLARRLKFRFKDIDRIIAKDAGMTIAGIFRKKGEPYFRHLERKTLSRVCRMDRVVIAPGGGAVKSAANRRLMKKNGIVVALKAKPEVILKRLKNDHARPLLFGPDKMSRIKKVLRERRGLYSGDLSIDTSNLTVSQTVEKIIKWLGSKNRIS